MFQCLVSSTVNLWWYLYIMVVQIIEESNSWNEFGIVLGIYGKHLVNNSYYYNYKSSVSVVGDLIQGDEFCPLREYLENSLGSQSPGKVIYSLG